MCVALQNMYPLHHRSINKSRVVNTEIENLKHEVHKKEQASNNNDNGGEGRWHIKPSSERKSGEFAVEEKLWARRNTNYFMNQRVACQTCSSNAFPAFLLFSRNKCCIAITCAHCSELLPYCRSSIFN